MSISNIRKLIILSSITFLLQLPSYAQDDGKTNQEEANAYLKKKEAALENSYGSNAFSLALSDEDKEIGRAIQKMTRQNKTPEQINKRVSQIKEKYRLKSVVELAKRAKLHQAQAEKDYRTQLNEVLEQSKTGTDLHAFIRHTLISQLSLLPRDFEKLENIEEGVARTYSHIAPLYEDLLESNNLLKTIISDYEQGKYTQSIEREKKALKENKRLLSKIKKIEEAISSQEAFDLIYQNQHRLPKLDRQSLLDESERLTKDIVLSRDASLKNLNLDYVIGYTALKKQVEGEIRSPHVSPLRKKLLQNHFYSLPSHGFSTEKLSEFSKELNKHLAYAGDTYNQLETHIEEFNLLRKNPRSG
ncbi:MAG: hypothetical protein ABI041_14645, partial [Bdellovibrionia bacterium]